MEDRVGRYPFATYGLLLAEASTGFALETQTLSLFERDLFTDPALPAWYVESIMVHELAHQWFGDSVSPRTWADLWLNEGHATGTRRRRRGARRQVAGEPDAGRVRVLRRLARRRRTARRAEAAQAGPQDRHLPSGRLRRRRAGAVRPAAGDRTEAFDRLERVWVARHRDGNASTADFVRLASETAGRDLTGFLHAWLYDDTTPPMPGHPDWRSSKRAATEESDPHTREYRHGHLPGPHGHRPAAGGE
ncbi:Aminopeptidase N OS=Streptomyces albaduncus OX=68172 GN=FHS32_006133 PE=3 SV=1 [Streptomyces griseoloalbus]